MEPVAIRLADCLPGMRGNILASCSAPPFLAISIALSIGQLAENPPVRRFIAFSSMTDIYMYLGFPAQRTRYTVLFSGLTETLFGPTVAHQ